MSESNNEDQNASVRGADAAESCGTPEASDGADETRRGFLGNSARKLAYAAPIVLLFRPEPACASGGSQVS